MAVLKEDLLPEVSRLASRATRLTQKWLASDLEVCPLLLVIVLYVVCVQVVAIRGYQPVGKNTTDQQSEAGGKKEERATTDGPVQRGEEEEDEKETEEEEGKKAVFRKAEEACLEGLSDDIQDMLVVGSVGAYTVHEVWYIHSLLFRSCRRPSSVH